MKTKPLSEQVAIITGGGTGIGRSFSEALARAGAGSRYCLAAQNNSAQSGR